MLDPSVLIGQAARAGIAEDRGTEIVTRDFAGALGLQSSVDLAVDQPAQPVRLVRVAQTDDQGLTLVKVERGVIDVIVGQLRDRGLDEHGSLAPHRGSSPVLPRFAATQSGGRSKPLLIFGRTRNRRAKPL